MPRRTLTNSGTINIGAFANATATAGRAGDAAYASASVSHGISQYAMYNGGAAKVNLNNTVTGTINIDVSANANGHTEATANAYIGTGILQYAQAEATTTAHNSANAAAALTNAGTINILAHARAIAPNVTNVDTVPFSSAHTTYPDAYASAYIGIGISQAAYAKGATASLTIAGGGGTTTSTFKYGGVANASAAITNSGTINIGARATATAADASAVAGVGTGVHQSAHAIGGSAANATALISNVAGAKINVGAVAIANGSSHASAVATVGDGIDQTARAYSAGPAVASASLTNAGAIAIGASAAADADGANSLGTPGSANAYASVGTGIYQEAHASGHATHTVHVTPGGTTTTYQGSASAVASINNSGTIAITAGAVANAAGDATAEARIGSAIYQDAFAYAASAADATASITNAGTIHVLADAVATAGSY